TPELAKTLEEVLGELPQELKVFLVDAANHSECWRKFRTSPHMRVEGSRGVGCKHGLLLARAYEDKKKKVKEVFLAPLLVSGEEDEYFRQVWMLRFKEPVLLIGEPGCGKTYTAERVANLALSELQNLGFEAQVFRVQGNSSVEGVSLLGTVVRGKDDEFRLYLENLLRALFAEKWDLLHTLFAEKSPSVEGVDEDDELRLYLGDLLRAFRFAEKSPNHRAILIIDEVFRIHPREQSVIVSALTEVWRDGKPHYLLKHPDFPKLEVWVPKERLWVIATGNLGGNFKYSVASDQALLDRFSTIWMTLTREKLASVIQPILQKKGWEHLLQPLLNLRVAAEELVKRGELSVAPSIRT
ncbi:MAG: AAA family ATPase, partial [Aquificaceae bacterium]|nr:AAA family ATPase [Aquificaceae bacterium]